MKKTAVVTILIILLSLPYAVTVWAEGGAEQILDDYADVYSDVFKDGLSGVAQEGNFLNIIDEINPKEILAELNSGRLSLDGREIINLIIKLLLGEVYKGLGLLASVLAMAVLSSYLGELKSGFGAESVAECAFFVCYIIIAGISASAFYQAVECTVRAVDSIAFFMRFLVPVLLTAMMTSGAILSAATLEPALLTMIEVAVFVIQKLFIPAVLISTALGIVGSMSDRFKTDRLVGLLNKAVRWGLSLTLTIFVSLAGLKSIASAGADGLTVRLSKFAASNLVPMVGGILSESAETVMNCSAVIKNSVGILGIICVVIIAMGPVLKLGSMLILMRLTAAVTEPVSDPKIVDCISRLANSVSVLFSMVAVIMVMFIIVVTIIINAGNTAITLGN